MTIYKPNSYIEAYRLKAKSKDINELSGRSGRADLTKFIVNQIINKIDVKPAAVLVDVGCGDGLLLQQLALGGIETKLGALVGILPTEEEVLRVKNHLKKDELKHAYHISIQQGLLENTKLPSNFADFVICNGVLIYANSLENAIDSIIEIT